MINALQNSLNQMSDEEKRRKRRAELQGQLNKLRSAQHQKRVYSTSGLVDTGESMKMQPQITALQEEFDSLNY
jgi:hypothetical protein